MSPQHYIGLPDKTQLCFRNGVQSDSLSEIFIMICDKLKVDPILALSKSRKKEHATARMICIGLFCRVRNQTLKSIGLFFNRDHSTIMYNRDIFNDLLFTKDPLILKCIQEINN